MGHDDLERRLRTEQGPREDGYRPARLPADLGPRRRRAAGMPLLRWSLLGGAAVAAVLVVATAAALFSPSGDVGSTVSPSSTPTRAAEPTPTAAVTAAPSGELAACTSADFAVSTNPWGAAAGSRGTNVVLRLVDGAAPCTLDGAPAAGIDDASGQALVRTTPVSSSPLVLHPGEMVTVGISWSNWCQDPPAAPLGAWMVLSGTGDEPGADRIPLLASDGGEVPVPPCMAAAGDPGSMGITTFQPYSGPRPQG